MHPILPGWKLQCGLYHGGLLRAFVSQGKLQSKLLGQRVHL